MSKLFHLFPFILVAEPRLLAVMPWLESDRSDRVPVRFFFPSSLADMFGLRGGVALLSLCSGGSREPCARLGNPSPDQALLGSETNVWLADLLVISPVPNPASLGTPGTQLRVLVHLD
ncbi:predicted protein [Verticillium alfalfae VaMs.102]|uniref:Predicted protein n=1 Tax=Verticillium alfalfae (strain VaMs.102 / ATCC MYA-4576 / FGSC 10136) TaxID=526221 RepID=C9SNK0_VERA1|nr:predicted protein [Verticillium alfalfae VaMs.102]EEY20365.1 predicted protein [Verticillium alfalfae VaMs.102]